MILFHKPNMFEKLVVLVRFCFNDDLKWKNFKLSVSFLVLNSYAILLAEVTLILSSEPEPIEIMSMKSNITL